MKARRLQKPIGICALALFLLLSLFLQQSFGALKCYNWYFKKNEEHKQPPLDSEFWMIDQYETYYLDRSANDTDRVLYLTFDAGYENGNVEKVVDALNAQGVPGAFFVLSHLAKANAPLLQKMVQGGHTVCNHTANHKDMTKCEDAQAFAAELDALRQDCAAIGVPVANYYRPPQGRFCEKNLAWAKELGYRTIFWSFAYCDWDNGKQPDPAAALKNILEHTHPGAVILLHPTSATNAEILPKLLEEWKAQGYRFGTLDELVAREHARREKEANEPQSNYRTKKPSSAKEPA